MKWDQTMYTTIFTIIVKAKLQKSLAFLEHLYENQTHIFLLNFFGASLAVTTFFWKFFALQLHSYLAPEE